MPIVHEFDYVRPGSLREAVTLLARRRNSVILSGGTDLVDLLKENILRPDVVVDIKGLEALGRISFEKNTLNINAGVTFTDLIESGLVRKKFPVIAELAGTVASVGIRNRATVVGNICSAVPCMDSGPLLSAYGANIRTISTKGKRTLPAEKFFRGNRKTALTKGEIVTTILLPYPEVPHAGCWIKLGRYTGEDLAQVSLLVLALGDGSFRIAFGAVAPVPVRARKIETLLNGETITPALMEKAKKLIEQEIRPISDVRASKEYRMHMAKVMFERALGTAIRRLNGTGPDYGTRMI